MKTIKKIEAICPKCNSTMSLQYTHENLNIFHKCTFCSCTFRLIKREKTIERSPDPAVGVKIKEYLNKIQKYLRKLKRFVLRQKTYEITCPKCKKALKIIGRQSVLYKVYDCDLCGCKYSPKKREKIAKPPKAKLMNKQNIKNHNGNSPEKSSPRLRINRTNAQYIKIDGIYIKAKSNVNVDNLAALMQFRLFSEEIVLSVLIINKQDLCSCTQ